MPRQLAGGTSMPNTLYIATLVTEDAAAADVCPSCVNATAWFSAVNFLGLFVCKRCSAGVLKDDALLACGQSRL